MVDTQNEIKYSVAFSILKKLLMDGLITRAEFEIAHGVVADRFCPLAVCRLP